MRGNSDARGWNRSCPIANREFTIGRRYHPRGTTRFCTPLRRFGSVASLDLIASRYEILPTAALPQALVRTHCDCDLRPVVPPVLPQSGDVKGVDGGTRSVGGSHFGLEVDTSLWSGGVPPAEGRSEAELLNLAYG